MPRKKNKNPTCQTPTMALAMRMRRMTKGSTKAVIESLSSKKARTKEMMAARSRILTSRSSNCSRISSKMVLPASTGSSGGGEVR